MQTITKFLAVIALGLSVQVANAQDTIQRPINYEKIEVLNKQRTIIENQEKDALKQEVEAINKRLENGEITFEEAETLKKQSAEKRALNIQNRLAIIDNKIELLQRNPVDSTYQNSPVSITIGSRGIHIKNKNKPIKYDIKTSNDLLFAVGLNNSIIDGSSLGDSPYKFGGSGFVELGWNWKTRLFKNTPEVRLKYGFSFQWNKLNPKDDKYFVANDGETTLEDFPVNLSKSEFRVTNLVFPVYFEFGPMRKLERETHIRYINNNKFKIGLGGYAGFNIGAQQKLIYKDNGDKVKDKIKSDYNVSDFVYGLGGYIGFDDIALYVKYDLNPIFKDQAVDQNNISIGLRFDID